jgi:NAD(P)H-dependent nitrite reductase small subunit
LSEFVRVAELSEITEGLGRVVEFEGTLVALFKVGQDVFAIENECPHNGGPLGDGTLDGAVLTCPWHAWRFDLRTGRAVHAPIVRVPTWRVRIEGGAVHLAPRGDGPP